MALCKEEEKTFFFKLGLPGKASLWVKKNGFSSTGNNICSLAYWRFPDTGVKTHTHTHFYTNTHMHVRVCIYIQMWQVTGDMWHVTCVMWHVTGGGRWTFSQNFFSLIIDKATQGLLIIPIKEELLFSSIELENFEVGRWHCSSSRMHHTLAQ